MKPEKLQALLLKLRKGAGSSLKVKELLPVFDYLGNWTFEATMLLVPESRSYSNFDNEPSVRNYINAHPGNVQTTWEQAKAREVSKLPDPNHVKKHDRFYMEVSDIKPFGNDTGFSYLCWQATEGTKVISPDRDSIIFNESLEKFLDSYPTNIIGFGTKTRFSEWLKNASPWLKQINEKLNMPSIEEEKEQAKALKKRTLNPNIGTCGVCFGEFKLLPKAKEGKERDLPGLVLHGYQRPGLGYIHSNCYGEFWPPYELSCEVTKKMKERLEQSLQGSTDYLRRLTSGEVTSFTITEVKVDPLSPSNKVPSLKSVKKEDMDPREWAKLLKKNVGEVTDTITDLNRVIRTLTKAIADWKLMPLNLTFGQ